MNESCFSAVDSVKGWNQWLVARVYVLSLYEVAASFLASHYLPGLLGTTANGIGHLLGLPAKAFALRSDAIDNDGCTISNLPAPTRSLGTYAIDDNLCAVGDAWPENPPPSGHF